MKSKNYYEILQVAHDATQEEIKKAFREQAKIWHPDVNKSSDATEKMQSITEAYNVLSDVNKRREYDKRIANNSKGSSSTMYNSNEKAYASYTKSREESESDFDEWLKEYLKKLNKKELEELRTKILRKYDIDICGNDVAGNHLKVKTRVLKNR